MVDRNQTKQALANLSGRNVRGIDTNRLATRFARVAADKRNTEAQYKARDTTPEAFVRHLRDKAAAQLGKESEKTSSHLPVSSVYDALQIAKQHKSANTDAGIRAFKGMLNSMWQQDRTSKVTAAQFVKYREYYAANFPKSAVTEVLDTIGEKGYASLPVSSLLAIARRIHTQEDYDREIVTAGLHTKQPHHIKSREFIRSVINGATETSVPNPFDRYDEQESEYAHRIDELIVDYGEDVVDIAADNTDALLAEYQVTRVEADPGQDGGDPVDEDTQDMSFLGALEEIEEDAWEFGGRWWTSTDNQKIFGYDDGLQISVFIKHLDGSDLTQSEFDLFNLLRSEGATHLYVEVAEYLSEVKNPEPKTTRDPRQMALPHVGKRRKLSSKQRVAIRMHKAAAKKSIKKARRGNRLTRRAQQSLDLDEFTRSAFETLVQVSPFEDVDESGVALEDLDAKSLELFVEQCQLFQTEYTGLLNEAYASQSRGTEYTESDAGRDFILARNGIGSGFMDRDFGGLGIEEELDEAAMGYGYMDIYPNKSGELRIELG